MVVSRIDRQKHILIDGLWMYRKKDSWIDRKKDRQ